MDFGGGRESSKSLLKRITTLAFDRPCTRGSLRARSNRSSLLKESRSSCASSSMVFDISASVERFARDPTLRASAESLPSVLLDFLTALRPGVCPSCSTNSLSSGDIWGPPRRTNSSASAIISLAALEGVMSAAHSPLFPLGRIYHAPVSYSRPNQHQHSQSRFRRYRRWRCASGLPRLPALHWCVPSMKPATD